MKIFKKNISRKYDYIIDFCSRYIKVLRVVNQDSKFLIDGIYTLDLEEISKDKVKVFFSRLFSVKEKINLVTFITRKDTTIKYFNLPATSIDEISRMISFQIDKKIPYPVTDISFDYKVLSVDEKGYSSIEVAVAHKKKIQQILNNFNEYGLILDEVILDIDALTAWFNYQLKESDVCIGLIDVDINKINLIVMEKSKLVFSRSISIGFADFNNNDEEINKVVSELLRSFKAYEKNNQAEVKKLIITGAEDSFKYLLVGLREGFSGEIVVKSSLENIPIKVSKEKIDASKIQILSFSYLIGAAISSKKTRFDFLPAEFKLTKEFQKKKDILKKIAIPFVFLIVIGFSIILHRFYSLDRQLSLIEGELNSILPEASKVQEEVSFMRSIFGYLSNRTLTLEILHEIYTYIPSNITLYRLDYSKNEQLRLFGEASNIADVFSFVSQLEKSDYFIKVEAGSVNVTERMAGRIVNFEIICLFY